MIADIFREALAVRDVPFPVVVQETSDHKVIPFDPSNSDDVELKRRVEKAAKSFLDICRKTGRTYGGKDPRNVSRPLEEEFVPEMSHVGLTARRLAGSGYPDHGLVDQAGRLTYFETKVSSQIEKSSARSFYYSGGKKVKADARHLLIGWEIEEESTRHWKVLRCRLVDLSKIRVSLKTEFNANNPEIYKPEAILWTS